MAGPLVLQALLQGFVAGVAGIVLYGIAIDRLGASRAAALSPLSIVLAALLAIPVLGEIPDAAAMIGITLATLGVVLASGVVQASCQQELTTPVTARSADVLFFSNRLGCAGSLLISAVLTLIVLALMGVF